MTCLPTALLMWICLLISRMCRKSFESYLPLMGKIITGMGAAGFTYEEIAKRIALKMGGLGYDLGHRLFCGRRYKLAKDGFFF